MNRIVKTLGFVALLALVPALDRDAAAYPVLQLDMLGGVYDPVTETIVASGGPFTVFAILTPGQNATPQQIDALLNTTYYISVALTPQTSMPGSLGSFTFRQQGTAPVTTNVTADMTYGIPPIEVLETLQGWDPGDLSRHGVYPTYFREFAFRFSAANSTAVYDTALNPGGPTPGPGGAYYATFQGDSSLLAAGYKLHFDLYDEIVRRCTGPTSSCVGSDIDINRFAPFSHDAQTGTVSVAEPATSLMVAIGLATVFGRRSIMLRRSGAGTTSV